MPPPARPPDVAAADDPPQRAVEPADRGITLRLDGGRPAHFSVHLEEFEGPFDLLLGLIAKRQLDVTTLALSKVTDDFLAHIRTSGPGWDLDQATEFLVVAATLLDLKAARLLPQADVEDEEDLALLEARDLLFARLLQYRAYKQAAALLAGMLSRQSRRFPRDVQLEPRYASVLPEVLLGLGPDQFAALAQQAFVPRPTPRVPVDHVHATAVSVRQQTALVEAHLRRLGRASFRVLTADCQNTLEVVARFLGLLELYRDGVVAFDQAEALSELHVRWVGSVASAGAAMPSELAGEDGPGGLD